MGCSLSADSNITIYSKGKNPENLAGIVAFSSEICKR